MAINQTPEDYIKTSETGVRGTGVFLNLLQGGGTFVGFQQAVTYAEAQRLGEGYAAFKWIPTTTATFAAIQGSVCRIPGEPCEATCTANGCICNPATKTCVDASQNGSGGGQAGGGELFYPGPSETRAEILRKFPREYKEEEAKKGEDELVPV